MLAIKLRTPLKTRADVIHPFPAFNRVVGESLDDLAASELGALSTAAFDATDPAPLERFFRDLPTPIDHAMVTAGRPHYGRSRAIMGAADQ